MTLRKKLALICGAAAVALTSTPAPLGLMRSAHAQNAADVEGEPDNDLAPNDKGAAADQDGDVAGDNAEEAKPDAADNDDGPGDNSVLEDEGAADDRDGDVTDDNIVQAKPDAADERTWSDAPANTNERRAEQVDADDYVQKCADKAACQATLNYVESQLTVLLQAHANRPVRRSNPKFSIKRSKVSKYTVQPGQNLERFAGKQGPNDLLLWNQVTQVLPTPQTDKYIGSFYVFRKRKDSVLAYVQGMDEGPKFILGVNEPNHLATDVREQYLTVVHEFMHMVVMNQFVGPQIYDESGKGLLSDLRSVAGVLQSIFGVEEDAAQSAAQPSGQSDDQTETPTAAIACDGITEDEGCYAKGSLYNEFTRKFWTKADLQAERDSGFYERNKSRFVTEYAITTPHEDMSESFSYWVIAEGKGKTMADAKQRFFSRYPKLVALKEHIRRAVIADILKAQKANP